MNDGSVSAGRLDATNMAAALGENMASSEWEMARKGVEHQSELDALIGRGIARIRKTWNKLGSFKLAAGPYGKQLLLQEIYTVYWRWRDSGKARIIWDRLARRLDDNSGDSDDHPLQVLIRVAIPEIRRNVVATWVDAIRFGESHNVRPFKLRGFLYVKEGLVRCAKLFREEEAARRKKEEIMRLDEEERQARIKQERRRRGERRMAANKPSGRFGLFDW
jgi:hypothetical protein